MTRPASPPRRLAWFALMALGLAILVVVALLRGDPQDVLWYLAHVLPIIAIVTLAQIPMGSRFVAAALVAYAVALPVLAWAVGFSPFDPWDEPTRLQLFTDNPNLLAADLVAMFWAAAIVRPRGPWAWLLPVVAVAVVLTGSRTALLALAIGAAAWLVVPTTPFRVRAGMVAGGMLVVGFVAFANHQVRQDAVGANLLSESTTFHDGAWRVYRDSSVDVTPRAVEGPWPGTRADRIVARSGESRLTLYQSLGISVENTEYVASVYLRADAPQMIVVSNHLAGTPCAVAAAWIRCITPVGVGNGRSATQFRFETPEPGQGFDVYAFGPQYEVGSEPTAYAPRGGGVLPSAVARRLAGSPVGLDAAALVRNGAWGMGRRAIAASLWLGNGVGWAANTVPPDGGRTLAHAHNLALERLATDGLAGLVGWLLVAGALVGPVVTVSGWRATPWLLALVVLNTWDATWFHSGSYFSTAVVVGLSVGRMRARTNGRGHSDVDPAQSTLAWPVASHRQ